MTKVSLASCGPKRGWRRLMRLSLAGWLAAGWWSPSPVLHFPPPMARCAAAAAPACFDCLQRARPPLELDPRLLRIGPFPDRDSDIT